MLASLAGVLSLTSVMLLALAPAPLVPDAQALLAVEQPGQLDAIYEQTLAPVRPGRWTYLYVHHSRSIDGRAPDGAAPGSHFTIGNGRAAPDGEIRATERWVRQESAQPPRGAREIDPACVRIELAGHFGQTRPTDAQVRRLGQLVRSLQDRLLIPADHIILLDGDAPTGMGSLFPVERFRAQLLP